MNPTRPSKSEIVAQIWFSSGPCFPPNKSFESRHSSAENLTIPLELWIINRQHKEIVNVFCFGCKIFVLSRECSVSFISGFRFLFFFPAFLPFSFDLPGGFVILLNKKPRGYYYRFIHLNSSVKCHIKCRINYC